jgi:hypothetical protein
VANTIGISEPSVALASTDLQVKQLVALLNKEGRELSSRYGWESLQFEQTFTTVATESQGTLASLISNGHVVRYVVNDTIWNRTRREPVFGPTGAAQWQAQKAFTITGPYSEYRFRGGSLIFQPTPTAGETCAFEFISKCWASNAGGTTFTQDLALDTDLVLLDDELVLTGLEWRWRKAKGLAYAEDFVSYERMVADAMARNGTKRKISLNGPPRDDIPTAIPKRIG